MDSLIGMMRGLANRGNEPKVFDWEKAAKIIKERNLTDASAGLSEDWFYTAGDILEGGKPVLDGGAYLSSNWATPVLRIETIGGHEEIMCYRMASETPGWDASTYWPDEALVILEQSNGAGGK